MKTQTEINLKLARKGTTEREAPNMKTKKKIYRLKNTKSTLIEKKRLNRGK